MVYYSNELDRFESYSYDDLESDEPLLALPAPSHTPHDAVQSAIATLKPSTERRSTPLDPPSSSSSPPVLAQAVAGALGSVICNAATYPLSVIHTRLQLQRHLLAQAQATSSHRRNGLKSRSSTTARRGRERERRRSVSSVTSTHKVLVPDASGAFRLRRVFTKPDNTVELLESSQEEWEGGDEISRSEADDAEMEGSEDDLAYGADGEEGYYTGVLDAFEKIWDREGFAALYDGLAVDTLATVVSGLSYWGALRALRKNRGLLLEMIGLPGRKKASGRERIFEELVLGILASSLSRFLASPLSTMVARIQTSRVLAPEAKKKTFADIFHDIMREKGVTGFWSGYGASLLLTLNPSLTFLLYEAGVDWGRDNGWRLEGRGELMLVAAVARMCATVISWPVSVARVRMQLMRGEEEDEDREREDRKKREYQHNTSSYRRRRKSSSASSTRRAHVKTESKSPTNVFSVILSILHREGLKSLYSGLGGELLKGLFAHAVTVLVKEGVHAAVLRCYWILLDAYSRSQDKTVVGATKVILEDRGVNLEQWKLNWGEEDDAVTEVDVGVKGIRDVEKRRERDSVVAVKSEVINHHERGRPAPIKKPALIHDRSHNLESTWSSQAPKTTPAPKALPAPPPPPQQPAPIPVKPSSDPRMRRIEKWRDEVADKAPISAAEVAVADGREMMVGGGGGMGGGVGRIEMDQKSGPLYLAPSSRGRTSMVVEPPSLRRA